MILNGLCGYNYFPCLQSSADSHGSDASSGDVSQASRSATTTPATVPQAPPAPIILQERPAPPPAGPDPDGGSLISILRSGKEFVYRHCSYVRPGHRHRPKALAAIGCGGFLLVSGFIFFVILLSHLGS